MDSWWELGNWSGYSGDKLAYNQVTCPFCSERGNFIQVFAVSKKKVNGHKALNYETLQCGNCANYTMVLWSAGAFGGSVFDFRMLPWPLGKVKAPAHWPPELGRYWTQAKEGVRQEHWDAAVVMIRSALQFALRERKATGRSLYDEIADLSEKGELPPLMKDWATNIRLLGAQAAHPWPGETAPSSEDVKDLLRFLDFLLEYLYDLPHRIAQYQQRNAGK